jgi:hypothetical protein
MQTYVEPQKKAHVTSNGVTLPLAIISTAPRKNSAPFEYYFPEIPKDIDKLRTFLGSNADGSHVLDDLITSALKVRLIQVQKEVKDGKALDTLNREQKLEALNAYGTKYRWGATGFTPEKKLTKAEQVAKMKSRLAELAAALTTAKTKDEYDKIFNELMSLSQN